MAETPNPGSINDYLAQGVDLIDARRAQDEAMARQREALARHLGGTMVELHEGKLKPMPDSSRD